MIVHVTGGSGFVGVHVLPMLVQRGHEISALVRTSRAAELVRELGARPIPGDLDDPASIDEAFIASGADALVNLASLGFGHAQSIVAAAEDAGITRAVFVSTTAILTRLDASSRRIRIEAERAVRDSQLDWTLLRPTMVYGTPADRNMARLLALVRWSPIVPLPGGGNAKQQPVHVGDLAQAIVTALESPVSVGKIYELAGPEALSFRQVVEQAAAAVGRRPRLLSVPLGPATAVLRVYQRFATHPRLRVEQLERLAEDKVFDIGPARHDLRYTPRQFAEGIRSEAAVRP
jgi:uncharacterized protein YbjT (DUF2867 family)